jgi:hypothetical protein
MKKRVMDDSRISKRMKELARKAIDVLNESRGACACYEAGKMRLDLQDALNKKEAISGKVFTDELIPALEEVAKFLKDPRRSFKSDDFKNLGDEISDFLQKIEIKDNSK